MNTDTVLSILGIAGCENCPDNSECMNVQGVNVCQCNQGYIMNGAETCVGKDSLFLYVLIFVLPVTEML